MPSPDRVGESHRTTYRKRSAKDAYESCSSRPTPRVRWLGPDLRQVSCAAQLHRQSQSLFAHSWSFRTGLKIVIPCNQHSVLAYRIISAWILPIATRPSAATLTSAV